MIGSGAKGEQMLLLLKTIEILVILAGSTLLVVNAIFNDGKMEGVFAISIWTGILFGAIHYLRLRKKNTKPCDHPQKR